MRSPLAVLAVLATLALAACGSDSGGESTPAASVPAPTATASASGAVTEISAADAGEQVEAGDGYLVDVREDDEWDAGHAPEAVHVPLGELSDAKLAELDEARGDKTLVFICRSGNRSAEAAAAAQAAGLEDVVSVAGGMGDWVAAGLPLEPQDGEII
jgi:rhodanese-related sulfurtransferase